MKVLNISLTLLGEKSDLGWWIRYKFEIQLPANLPPSLDFLKNNIIKYKITATARQI